MKSSASKLAAFPERNRGMVDGAVPCPPNFGDENGAAEVFAAADLPVFVLAGSRRHLSVRPGKFLAPPEKALTSYLGREVIRFQSPP